jgi:hypothetical protein
LPLSDDVKNYITKTNFQLFKTLVLPMKNFFIPEDLSLVSLCAEDPNIDLPLFQQQYLAAHGDGAA